MENMMEKTKIKKVTGKYFRTGTKSGSEEKRTTGKY
jgi:hypothetical protein